MGNNLKILEKYTEKTHKITPILEDKGDLFI